MQLNPFHRLSLESIHIADTFFQLRFPFSPALDQSMLHAVRANGIQQPIIVRGQGDGWQIVDGFRRVAAALSLPKDGLGVIPAMALPAEMTDLECLRQVCSLRHSCGGLNDIELGMLCQRIQDITRQKPHEYRHLLKDWLELDLTPHIIDDLIRAARFPDACRELIIAEDLPRKTTKLFQMFDDEALTLLVDFFRVYRFGRNKIRELLVWIDDICRRDRITVRQLLQTALAVTNSAVPMNAGEGPQTADIVWRNIRNQRFPLLTQQEATYRALQKELRLPPPVQLNVPPGFEGDKLDLRLQFASIAELNQVLQKLSDDRSGEIIQKMIDLL